MKKFLYVLGICILGIIGGWLGVLTMDWWLGITVKIPSANATMPSGDAIAIANTYIVFTTIIFTGLAIFIALIAYISSQEHTKHRKATESEFIKDLLNDCQKNEDHRNQIIESILGNRHTVELLESKLNETIRRLVTSNLEQLGYNISPTEKKLNETADAVKQRFRNSKMSKQRTDSSNSSKEESL